SSMASSVCTDGHAQPTDHLVGAPGQSRTGDLSLRRRLLYPLSYWGSALGMLVGRTVGTHFGKPLRGWQRRGSHALPSLAHAAGDGGRGLGLNAAPARASR